MFLDDLNLSKLSKLIIAKKKLLSKKVFNRLWIKSKVVKICDSRFGGEANFKTTLRPFTKFNVKINEQKIYKS